MSAQRFLQSRFWARFKASHGWKDLYFLVQEDLSLAPLSGESDSHVNESGCYILTVLVRSFTVAKVKKFSLAYVPMAPELAEKNAEEISRTLSALAQNLKPLLPSDCLFIRFDPPVDFFTPEERDAFSLELEAFSKNNALPLKKAPVCVQPPDTTILDLSKSEETLLSEMKSKWRYNIRLASKKGVVVSKHYGSDSDFDKAFGEFYRLFQETSERDGVSFHGKDYYIDLLKRGSPNLGQKEEVTLYLAEHEGDFLAGIITLFTEGEAVYLYGASGNKKRNLMPAYLLQWTAITDAKKYGSPCYDFYGMPPTSNENHPMHGLYLFKTGFGGQNTHRIGSWDVPLKKDYGIYLRAEKLRAWWFRKFVKKLHKR